MWVPENAGFVAFQKVEVFSYTDSFSLKAVNGSMVQP